MLGSPFASVTKLRRENVIRHVASSVKPLLKDPRAFSSRECERLFGSKFIDIMVKEVDDDAKLAKIGRDGGPSYSQNRGNSNRRNGSRSQGSYDSRAPTCRSKYQPPNFCFSLWREPTHKYIFCLTRSVLGRHLTGCITCVSCFRLTRSFDCSTAL
jgi:hypothetical protein